MLEALVADLRKRLDAAERAGSRNSGKSSMPPSSDDLPGRTPPRQRRAAERAEQKKRGKQPGSPGTSMQACRRPRCHRAPTARTSGLSGGLPARPSAAPRVSWRDTRRVRGGRPRARNRTPCSRRTGWPGRTGCRCSPRPRRPAACCAIHRIRLPFSVQTPADRPYGVLFAFVTASSGVRNVSTDSTGPKISSRAIRCDWLTPVKTVGANQ